MKLCEKTVSDLIEDHLLCLIGWLANVDVQYMRDINTQELQAAVRLQDFRLEKLSRVVWLLELVHKLSLDGRNCTQRELYYRSLCLFDNQAQLNFYVQGLSATLNLPRSKLGVFATEKGSIAGAIAFTKCTQTLSLCDSERGIILSESLLASDVESNASYILVVEKDAVYQSLCQDKIWERIPCILLTGKGNPDFATRKVLAYLEEKLKLPMAYVGDFDPFGLLIYLTYKYGTKSPAAGRCSCNTLKWIGMCAEDMNLLPAQAMIPLSKKDKKLLESILQQPHVRNNAGLLRQCELMKSTSKKFEIESLRSVSTDYLSSEYIPKKMLRHQWC